MKQGRFKLIAGRMNGITIYKRIWIPIFCKCGHFLFFPHIDDRKAENIESSVIETIYQHVFGGTFSVLIAKKKPLHWYITLSSNPGCICIEQK